ncbi:MAG: aminoglycoside 6-adenylyltransferase [Euryarchaeota archaeon]|nr:aminoglycoside 6-adenylyltransferase [Euryarchaeota archaeon]MDE1835094.1 aminoglycoside 6-adenylyltransferase [Euryarchaeota archaeon]MDE1879366.1 aminoglycoside 6-adenylyltransferase [Euryarchaeota archaeon]MDE2044943.1 aminoglycoside 6-adenylyltransferase [Thermoplasmata archaeon]
MPAPPAAEWIPRLAHWSEADGNVRLAILVGSQARTNRPADAFSDIDVALFVRQPGLLLREFAWVEKLGRPWTVHREPNGLGSGEEVRVLFEDGQDVDLAVFPFVGRGSLFLYYALKRLMRHPEEVVLRTPGAAEVLARGFRVLTNKDGIVMPTAVKAEPPKLPTSDEFANLSNDYWFHLIWTAKKLRRGELLTSLGATNGYLRVLLVQMVRWHALARSNRAVDVWHDARFFETWADPRAVRDFSRTVARYDRGSIADALRSGRDLFSWLARDLGERMSFPPPVRDLDGVSGYLDHLLA